MNHDELKQLMLAGQTIGFGSLRLTESPDGKVYFAGTPALLQAFGEHSIVAFERHGSSLIGRPVIYAPALDAPAVYSQQIPYEFIDHLEAQAGLLGEEP